MVTNAQPISLYPTEQARLDKMRERENQMLTMLRMQFALNAKLDEEWQDYFRSWPMAILTESVEYSQHIHWEWWKHKPTNVKQAKIELVDIWHFIISLYMNVFRVTTKDLREDQILSFTHMYSKLPADSYFHSWYASTDEVSTMERVEDAVFDFVETLCFVRKHYKALVVAERGSACCDVAKAVATETVIRDERVILNAGFELLVDKFSALMTVVGLTTSELFKEYVIKNTLNRFRQDNGYKKSGASAYVKQWVSWENDIRVTREDNEALAHEIDRVGLPTVNAEQAVYEIATKLYKVTVDSNTVAM